MFWWILSVITIIFTVVRFEEILFILTSAFATFFIIFRRRRLKYILFLRLCKTFFLLWHYCFINIFHLFWIDLGLFVLFRAFIVWFFWVKYVFAFIFGLCLHHNRLLNKLFLFLWLHSYLTLFLQFRKQSFFFWLFLFLVITITNVLLSLQGLLYIFLYWFFLWCILIFFLWSFLRLACLCWILW